tara:strand:- start:17565 stop:19184 length:1620 start_codon:yes stop_codon:yes gene_type:complete
MSVNFKVIKGKKQLIISVFCVFCNLFLSMKQEIKAQVISNNGAYVSISSGIVIDFDTMNVDNTTTINNEGTINASTINNAGTIEGNGNYNIASNFINIGTFVCGTSTVNFDGTEITTIGGSNAIEFYNLTFNNTFATAPQITLGINATAKNNLTMTKGKANLAGFTLTLGAGAAAPGTLNYTEGWLYGGTFKRWFNNVISNAIPTSVGHFPMGTSVADYRPLWGGYSAALTSGGTISVVHNPVYPPGSISASHTDSSWAGGTVLEGRSNSSWAVSTANGLASSGSNISIRLGGTGFNPFSLLDVNLSLSNSVLGTYAASTNDNTALEVNRTGLSTADLTSTFYIGTKSIANSPLAIQLLYFVAKCDNRNINISWATASENNNDYFTLERTHDGINFKQLERFDGAGNSAQTINYSFIDNEPLQGISYYRLRQTDIDGKDEYFNLTSVSCGQNDSHKFKIFPNPAVSNITVTLDLTKIDAESYIVFYDIRGKEVMNIRRKADSNRQIRIDINDLEPGCYIMRLTHGDDTCQTVRLIKTMI